MNRKILKIDFHAETDLQIGRQPPPYDEENTIRGLFQKHTPLTGSMPSFLLSSDASVERARKCPANHRGGLNRLPGKLPAPCRGGGILLADTLSDTVTSR